MEDYEVAHLADVTDGGFRLVLTAPLAHEHLGETRQLPEGHAVSFRGNVALLSRNVIVQGDLRSELDRHGAHIMLHSRGKPSIVDRTHGESLTARIENIEVRRAGQMGRIGRYSIHFHMIGAVRNSYVRYCSIHDTYNRAIAIHGVHYLRVQNNGARLHPSPHVHVHVHACTCTCACTCACDMCMCMHMCMCMCMSCDPGCNRMQWRLQP